MNERAPWLDNCHLLAMMRNQLTTKQTLHLTLGLRTVVDLHLVERTDFVRLRMKKIRVVLEAIQAAIQEDEVNGIKTKEEALMK